MIGFVICYIYSNNWQELIENLRENNLYDIANALMLWYFTREQTIHVDYDELQDNHKLKNIFDTYCLRYKCMIIYEHTNDKVLKKGNIKDN